MSAQNDMRPIIIKKVKKVSGDGHHGGAWKVAYADFVTAMMAFFMLMWLLNATTEQQRKGIADYFSPTVPISRISGGGDGSFGGDSPFSETVVAQNGTGASDRRPTEGRQAMGMSGADHNSHQLETAMLGDIEDSLLDGGGDSRLTDGALDQVQTRLTDVGLIIEIYARPNAPLFLADDAGLQPWMLDLSALIASLMTAIDNPVAIGAHVRAGPIVAATDTGWERTNRQAQLVREALEAAGLAPERVVRVIGHSDRTPAVESIMDVRNDRIELTIIRNFP